MYGCVVGGEVLVWLFGRGNGGGVRGGASGGSVVDGGVGWGVKGFGGVALLMKLSGN